MSALPAQLARPDAGPRPAPSDRAAWFPIDDAARLLGKHRAALNRDCVSKLEAQGLARRMPLALGGRPVWHIHARYSPRLVRAGVEQTAAGTSAVHERLAAATDAQRTEAARKARLVVEFRAWKATLRGQSVREAYAGFAATHDRAPSYTSIKKWSSYCPTSDDLSGCMCELLDTRGRPREGAPGISEAARELYCELYLHPNQDSHGKCWRAVQAVAREKRWTWPSEDTVARARSAWMTQSQIDMGRLGKDRWAKIHKTPIEQDPEAWAAGQCWEGDNSTLDFFARVWRDGAWRATRPILSAWKDRSSRRIMGWHIADHANSTTIRLAFLDALKAPGVGLPEQVWIDNGKDYKSQALTGVTKAQRRKLTDDQIANQQAQSTALFCLLGVQAHFAVAYNHNGKARIERGFSFIHQDFDREYASWCGSDEGDRPDAKHHRSVVREVMELPTLDQVRADFAGWAAWFNARREHAIQDLVVMQDGAPRRLSPVEFYERFLPVRRLAQEQTLELLRMPFEPKSMAVTKRGVRVTIDGKAFFYGGGHPSLVGLVGTDARVYVSFDDADRSQVAIYDTSFRRVCVAPLNQLMGGSAIPTSAVKEALRRQRQLAADAKRRPSILDRVLKPEELAAKIAREQDVAQTRDRLREAGHQEAAASANVRLVGTAIDEAARATPARKAVGSDADAMPQASPYGDILLSLAGASDGRFTAVGSRHNDHAIDVLSIDRPRHDPVARPEIDLLAFDVPDEDDGGDILATLGGSP